VTNEEATVMNASAQPVLLQIRRSVVGTTWPIVVGMMATKSQMPSATSHRAVTSLCATKHCVVVVADATRSAVTHREVAVTDAAISARIHRVMMVYATINVIKHLVVVVVVVLYATISATSLRVAAAVIERNGESDEPLRREEPRRGDVP
jgi:hypothetical protein